MTDQDSIILKEVVGKLMKTNDEIERLEKAYIEVCSDEPDKRSPIKREVCDVFTTTIKQLDQNTGELYNSLQILQAKQQELLKGDTDGGHKTEQ